MAFAGRIPVKINHQEAINARDVSVKGTRNQVIHKFANGTKGRSKGQSTYEWTITFSCPEDRQQFVQLSEGGVDDDGELAALPGATDRNPEPIVSTTVRL